MATELEDPEIAPAVPSPSTSPSTTASSRPDDWKLAAVVAAVYLAVATWNASSHVMWRDELRFWQFAVASPTFAEMRSHMRFEGAPWLWYGMLWLVSRLTSNPFGMQLLHVVIAAGSVFLFVRRGPFSRAAKLLFPLGYFTLFEYATISRSYGLTLFLVLCASAVIVSPRCRPVLLGCVLFLLTQINIWGVGLAGALCISAVIEWVILRPARHRLSWGKGALLGGVVLVGGVVCYVSSLPGPGESFVARWGDEPFDLKLGKTIGSIWKGWVPIPKVRRAYWNSNILDDHVELRCGASIAMLAAAVMVLARRPAALVPLVLGSAGLLWFTLFHFLGSVRHDGLLFILLIAACWIGADGTTVPIRQSFLARANERLEPYGNALFVGLLALQAIAGIGATIADHRLPFTAAKEVATFVNRKLPADAVLVGYDDYASAAMGFYAGRPIHSIQAKAQSPFFTQNDNLRRIGKGKLLVQQISRLLQTETRDVFVFLSPYRNDELNDFYERCPITDVRWDLIAEFHDTTIEDEGPFVFRVARKAQNSGPLEPTME